MDSQWFKIIKSAKKTSIRQDNLKKVHYEFENGKEMVEEYNMSTNVLTRRAWRIKNDLGAEGGWDIEIGDPEPKALRPNNDLIAENCNEPFVSRRVTRKSLEWRIRNLPYPLETYSVLVEPEHKSITVRTANKKYFKRLQIPDLERISLVPKQSSLTFTHKFNTLIITYEKPAELLELEQAIFEEIKKVPSQNSGDKINDCKPS